MEVLRALFRLLGGLRAYRRELVLVLVFQSLQTIATLTLPDGLAWRRLEGQTDPPAGWYSPAFGVRVPTVTLVGSGRVGPGRALVTVLQLDPGGGP